MTNKLISKGYITSTVILDESSDETKVVKDEQGLESLGRPVNDYFKDQYREDDIPISLKDSGRNLTDANLGNKVGDVVLVDDAAIITVVFIAATGYVVYRSWWEKDRAGTRGHGGSTWKRWSKKPKPKNKSKDRRTIGDDGKVIRE